MARENEKYHSPSLEEKKKSWPTIAWPLFLIFLLVPILAAYLLPTTGNFIVDMVIMAAPLTIAGILLFPVLFFVFRADRAIFGEDRETPKLVFIGYLIIIFGVSLGTGFWLGDSLKEAAIERFGEASKTYDKDELPPIEDVREID